MSRPRLLLVPFVTELEWETIRPELEDWAEVAAYDPPGVGEEPPPEGIDLRPAMSAAEAGAGLERWREACASRGLAEVERRGWERFFVVCDSFGIPPGVRIASARPDRVIGIALGHAKLDHTREGDRPAVRKEIWEAMAALMRTDQRAFISYGLAQLTQGGVSEEQARRWQERFPDADFISALWEVLGDSPEPIGERLRELAKPLLLAEHEGCLMSTEEGYQEAVEAFPDARTVVCPEACLSSPAFAEALREFCGSIEGPIVSDP